MNGFFNENNILNVALLKIWDIVLANLLFILCSIPLITIGPSFTALYHCTLRMVKGNNAGTLKTFFRAFKQNFKQSIIVWLITVLCAFILYNNFYFLKEQSGIFSQVFLSLTFAMALLLIIINICIYPVIAAFEGTLIMQLKNAFIFISMNFFKMILIFILWTLPLAMTYVDTGLQPLYVFCWFFFLFSLLAYLSSVMFYKMFRPYLEPDDGTDIPKYVDDDGGAYLP